jgi:hypothetical protein
LNVAGNPPADAFTNMVPRPFDAAVVSVLVELTGNPLKGDPLFAGLLKSSVPPIVVLPVVSNS